MSETARVEILRAFDHADNIHPVQIPAGVYDIADGESAPANGVISPRAAEVALAEGWAKATPAPKPRKGKKAVAGTSAADTDPNGGGRPSPGSGEDEASASSQAGPASTDDSSSESTPPDGAA